MKNKHILAHYKVSFVVHFFAWNLFW